MTRAAEPRRLTGRKVLAIVVAFFAVIIAVNGYMAWRAVSGFPGLVEARPYAASQRFDAEAKAEKALGWVLAADYANGVLRVRARWAEGARGPAAMGGPVRGLAVAGIVGRPATDAEDREVAFTPEGEAYVARLDLPPGRWHVMLTVEGRGANGKDGVMRINADFEVAEGG